ncbi:hypothetical protein AB0P21_32890 [Kribbella sp. NPDC056861]|uniref:hypothetical protein n=1 Tax=Kribbella sp. NPDC056861 TaxID=3154857 RepID=UPI00343FF51F
MTRRLLTGVVGTMMLLIPGITAYADDDPAPPKWPSVQDFGTSGGTADDPKPLTWPDVAQPNTDSSADPKPTTWPAPEPL